MPVLYKVENYMSSKERSCFVIRPIGEAGSNVRSGADDRYENIITPVCSDCGYVKIYHAGEIASPGMISRDVIEGVVDSDLVIADLTDNNSNVFYELALRHALRRPYVCIAPDGQRPPFDTNDCRYVPYRLDAFNATEVVRSNLKLAINGAVEKASDIESPISNAIDIMRLGSGGEIARSVKAIRENTERLLSILGEVNGGVGFKIYEKLEEKRMAMECVMEEIVMDLQHRSDGHSSWVLERLRVLEQLMNDVPKTDVGSVVIAYLRELVEQKALR